MCADPYKDPSHKGCGCWLYALHPSAVHLDHVHPRSKGGSDDIENMQALCLFCNTRAGARVMNEPTPQDIARRARETLEATRAEVVNDDEEDQSMPIRQCPECGEFALGREHWRGYGLGDQYKWHCRECGALRAGGEERDSELFPYPFE